MSNFDKIIGYDAIKQELLQVCDMINNRKLYDKLGARLPKGILLYGNPGLGKTLMAKCLIEESGLTTYTIRKTKSENFVEHIFEVFEKAKETSPSIIFLDDMDKFANEDSDHVDAEEYVAIQAGIDSVKDKEVFVIATANEMWKLPRSLTRAGRFDKTIEVCSPNSSDCKQIIEFYLKDKKVSKDINIDDISKMITYSSCADLETILNEGAMIAAYKRKKHIEMSDIVNAVLKTEYNAPDNYVKVSEAELKRVACHEAGHVVMSELLCNESVGLASLRTSGNDALGGFVRRCKQLSNYEHHALVSLAGKASAELFFGSCADGCEADISRAVDYIRRTMADSGSFGLGFVDVTTRHTPEKSHSYIEKGEGIVQAELNRLLFKAKELLYNNRDFLEAVINALLEKETLLASDIMKIKNQFELKF